MNVTTRHLIHPWSYYRKLMRNMFMEFLPDQNVETACIAMKQVPKNESLILVATGQKIGEGFDFPRLDVLMLAAPVSFEGRLEQYVGRLN